MDDNLAPLPLTLYVRHGFCSESEDVEGYKVSRPFLLIPWSEVCNVGILYLGP